MRGAWEPALAGIPILNERGSAVEPQDLRPGEHVPQPLLEVHALFHLLPVQEPEHHQGLADPHAGRALGAQPLFQLICGEGVGLHEDLTQALIANLGRDRRL